MAQRWPLITVMILSVAGLGAAAFRISRVSAPAYVALLLAGCSLLFYRRYDAIRATRRAGGVGVLAVQRAEQAAIASLALACLANGVVIALDVATWPVWGRLWGQQ